MTSDTAAWPGSIQLAESQTTENAVPICHRRVIQSMTECPKDMGRRDRNHTFQLQGGRLMPDSRRESMPICQTLGNGTDISPRATPGWLQPRVAKLHTLFCPCYRLGQATGPCIAPVLKKSRR